MFCGHIHAVTLFPHPLRGITAKAPEGKTFLIQMIMHIGIIMSSFHMAFLLALVVSLSFAYDVDTPDCYCYDCRDCVNAMADRDCTNIYLSDDISVSGDCILAPNAFRSKKFDCQGYAIVGTGGSGEGILMDSDNTNNIVTNCSFSNFATGIHIVDNSSDNLFTNNWAHHNSKYGLHSLDALRNIFEGNTFNNNDDCGAYVSGGSITFTSNFAYSNTKTCFYITSVRDPALTGNTAWDCVDDGFAVMGSARTILRNNTAYGISGKNGFHLENSKDSVLENNIAYSNKGNGFYLIGSPENILRGNIAYNNFRSGFFLQDFNMTEMTGNKAYNNGEADGEGGILLFKNDDVGIFSFNKAGRNGNKAGIYSERTSTIGTAVSNTACENIKDFYSENAPSSASSTTGDVCDGPWNCNSPCNRTNMQVEPQSPSNRASIFSEDASFSWVSTHQWGAISDCSLYIDSSFYGNIMSFDEETASLDALGLSSGRHEWYVYCEDGYGNSATSPTWEFTVRTSCPSCPSCGSCPEPTTCPVCTNRTIELPCNQTVEGPQCPAQECPECRECPRLACNLDSFCDTSCAFDPDCVGCQFGNPRCASDEDCVNNACTRRGTQATQCETFVGSTSTPAQQEQAPVECSPFSGLTLPFTALAALLGAGISYLLFRKKPKPLA